MLLVLHDVWLALPLTSNKSRRRLRSSLFSSDTLSRQDLPIPPLSYLDTLRPMNQ